MKRHVKFTHMMKMAKRQLLVKKLEKTTGEKLSEGQINHHLEYTKVCHIIEQKM